MSLENSQNTANANDQPMVDVSTTSFLNQSGPTTQTATTSPYQQGQGFGQNIAQGFHNPNAQGFNNPNMQGFNNPSAQGFHNPSLSFRSVQGSNPTFGHPGFNPSMAPMPYHQHPTMTGEQQGQYMPPNQYQQGYGMGSSTFSFPRQQPPQPAPLQGTGADEKWVFNPQLGLVAHAQHSCHLCNTMLSPSLDAIADNVTSYGEACAARKEYYQSGSSNPANHITVDDQINLHKEIGSLKSQLASEKSLKDALELEHNKDMKDISWLRAKRDGLRTSHNQISDELDREWETVNHLQDRIRELESRAPTYKMPVREGKRRCIERYSPLPNTQSPPLGEEGPIDYDNIDSIDIVPSSVTNISPDIYPPIVRQLVQCKQLPTGGACLPSGFIVYGGLARDALHNVQIGVPAPLGGTTDIRSVKKTDNIQSQDHYLSLLQEVRRYDNAGDFREWVPWKKWRMCKDIATKAQNLLEADRSNVHCCTLSIHFKPHFVTHKHEKDDAAKREAALQESLAGQPESYTLGQLPITNVIHQEKWSEPKVTFGDPGNLRLPRIWVIS